MLRLKLLQLDSGEQVLLLNMHHIVADGWSLGVLVRDLGELYAAALEGRASSLASPTLHYADYAAWQRGWLDESRLQGQLGYWREQLADAPVLLELPTDRPRPAVKTYQGAQLSVMLEASLVERLEALSRSQGATLFMTLLAAFKVLLFRYSGQGDVLVGSPIANRTHRQTEELVGFFVNTLVLRSRLEREQPFTELLGALRETTLDAYAHQDLPFETLVEELAPQRSLSHSPLFQAMFGLQNAPFETVELAGVRAEPLALDTDTAKFDLLVNLSQVDGAISGVWEFSTDLFDVSRMERMLGHYEALLRAIVEVPEEAIGRLSLLSDAERRQLDTWSGGASAYPRDAGLASLFAEQVATAPQAEALRFGDVSMSYAELDAASSRLAYLDALCA